MKGYFNCTDFIFLSLFYKVVAPEGPYPASEGSLGWGIIFGADHVGVGAGKAVSFEQNIF